MGIKVVKEEMTTEPSNVFLVTCENCKGKPALVRDYPFCPICGGEWKLLAKKEMFDA